MTIASAVLLACVVGTVDAIERTLDRAEQRYNPAMRGGG